MVRIVLQWFMWFLWSSVVAAIPHVMATDNNLHIDDKSRPRPIVSGARFRSFCDGLCGSISSSEMDAVTWISEEMLRRTE